MGKLAYWLLVVLLCSHGQNSSSEDPYRITATVSGGTTHSAGWYHGDLVLTFGGSNTRFTPGFVDSTMSIRNSDFKLPTKGDYELHFSRNGSHVSVNPYGVRSVVQVWTAEMKLVYSVDGRGNNEIPWDHRLSGDGNTLVLVRRLATNDLRVRWDLQTTQLATGETWSNELIFDGNDDTVTGVAVSPDDHLVFVALHKGTVNFVDIKQRRIVHSIRDTRHNVGRGIKFSPDGRFVGMVNGGSLVIFETETCRELCSWSPVGGQTDRQSVVCFDFSSDSNDVYVGITDWKLVPPASLVLRSKLDSLKENPNGFSDHSVSHSADFRLVDVNCSPDGKWIATVASTTASTEVSFCRPSAFDQSFPLSPKKGK